MAHRLLESDEPTPKKKPAFRKLKLPQVRGKIGVGIFLGGYEVFLGVQVSPVTVEEVTRRKTVPVKKGKVSVFTYSEAL